MGSLLKVVPFAEGELNTESVMAAYLTSVMGLSELFFRIPFGWAGDHPKAEFTLYSELILKVNFTIFFRSHIL